MSDPGTERHSINPVIGIRPHGLGEVTAEFGKVIADETEKWGKVIRSANIRTSHEQVLRLFSAASRI